MLENPLIPKLSMDADFGVQDWGLIDYETALQKMNDLLETVSVGESLGQIVFCTHPRIVTLGRATKAGEVTTWTGPTVEVNRGGSATYHGPSQLVIYPIVNLKNPRKHRGPQEIVKFIRDFEDAIVDTLKERGHEAIGRSVQKKDPNGNPNDETGVWVQDRKIASLGLAIKRWTTSHGAAINLDVDAQAFEGIQPCGFRREVMVSLEELEGKTVDRRIFQKQLLRHLLHRL